MMDRKLDRSLYTLQTGFTLGRHVSEGPTLIQALVGAAVTNQMIEELEYLLQQPGVQPVLDAHRSAQAVHRFTQGDSG